MKKHPNTAKKRAPHALRECELQTVKGGDGAGAAPGLDTGAIQQMQEQSFNQQ